VVDMDDVARDLHAWLVEQEQRGDKVDNLEVLSGGFSQFMAAFDLHTGSGSRRLVLRASRPVGQAITDTDRAAEWAVIQTLCERGDVPLPAGLWFDEGAALGVPCFVVEHVEGQTATRQLASADDAGRSVVADKLCDLMVAVHSVPTSEVPKQLEHPRDWDSHIDSLIDKWRTVERTGLEPDPFVRYMATWLESHKPPPAPLCLVHGEMNNDNLILDANGDLLAIDWEYAHIGDPREDLGWYRTAAMTMPPDLIGHDIDTFCARYRAATGLTEDVVNPDTVGYFGLLASVSVYSTLVAGPAAVEASAQAPALSAYMTAVLGRAHLIWLDNLRELEAALPAKSAHTSSTT